MASQEDDVIDRTVRAAVERARRWFDALVVLALGVGVVAGLDLVVEAAALRACS